MVAQAVMNHKEKLEIKIYGTNWSAISDSIDWMCRCVLHINEGSNPRFWHCYVDEDAMSWTKRILETKTSVDVLEGMDWGLAFIFYQQSTGSVPMHACALDSGTFLNAHPHHRASWITKCGRMR